MTLDVIIILYLLKNTRNKHVLDTFKLHVFWFIVIADSMLIQRDLFCVYFVTVLKFSFIF